MDGKICQNIKPLTPRRIPSSVQLSTWGRLEDKATKFLHFLFMLTILKSFLNKTKFKCFNKISIVFISLLSKMLKFRRSSLRLVFLINIVYNQFLILKNYRWCHWCGIHYIWLPHKPRNPNWSGVGRNFIKFEIQKGVWKRGKQAIIEAGFSK